ncbi:SDR family oxidoreductase [Thalassotalea sp. M1531]|uniref:SDR family oxidoreductase n=2 Tax=Thalassotalea algicola TaxID=2716224 RepID=A0A7Y0Q5A0_9GAMM|nr:SDR family oxidoreductase [Thalassotalea algicola]
METIDRTNQIALITGGATGIGLAISERLHSLGMKVIIASRRTSLINTQVDKLNQQRSHSALALTLDVTDKNSITESINRLPQEFSTIDVLINNAGVGVTDLLIDCPEDRWNLVINTTLKGPFLVSQAVLPQMIEKKSGFIINISSQAAKNGYPNAGPYCAAKFGLMGFAKALQEEVRDYNIQVHNLMPALTQVPAPKSSKEMTEGWLQTSDLADAAEYVLTRPARVSLEDIGLMGRM